MTICERLFEIMDKKGLNSASLCHAVGASSSTVANWKTRNTDPAAKFIVPICEFLGCSIEYLLTGKETKKDPFSDISKNGREMLELYEQLPEREQFILLGRLQEMVSPLRNEGKKCAAIAPELSTGKAM